MVPRGWTRRRLSIAISGGLFLVGIVLVTNIGAEEIIPEPDPETLNAEQGGTYISGSMEVVREGVDSLGRFQWRVETYDTTEYSCANLVWLSDTHGNLGSIGRCGAAVLASVPYVAGFVSADADALHGDAGPEIYSGAFETAVPVGTAKIRLELSNGGSIVALVSNGIWTAFWDGSAEVTLVQALSALDTVIATYDP